MAATSGDEFTITWNAAGIITGIGPAAARFKYGDMVRYKDGSGVPMMIVREPTQHDGDVRTMDFDEYAVVSDKPDDLEFIP